MPMYLCLMYAALAGLKSTERIKAVILTFIRDYGFLGGIMALIVHDGLIHPGYAALTAHGFISRLMV